jgi:hypothetical protein
VIYLIDEDAASLDELATSLQREFGHEQVRVTDNPALLLSWIAQSPPALVVTDKRAPLLLLQNADKNPDNPIKNLSILLLITQEEQKTFPSLQNYPALLRPILTEQVITYAEQLLTRSEKSPPGIISIGFVPISILADIVQLHTLSESTGVLQVENLSEKGTIHFSQGKIVHAQTHTKTGEAALFDIFSKQNEQFFFQAVNVDQQTINVPNDILLQKIEQMRNGFTSQDRLAVARVGAFSIDEDLADEENGSREQRPARTLTIRRSALLDLHKDPAPSPVPPPGDAPETTTERAERCAARLSTVTGFLSGVVFLHSPAGILKTFANTTPLSPNSAGLLGLLSHGQKLLTVLGESAASDIIFTTSEQYHIIRPFSSEGLAFYAIFDRARTNLGFTRLALAEAETELQR